MSFDFRRTHAKRGRIRSWHPHTHCHIFDPGEMSWTQVSLNRGLVVGLIEWNESLSQGSKDPPFSAKTCPSQQSTPWSNHKRQVTTLAEWRASTSQREAGQPPLGRPAWPCLRSGNASYTDSRRKSGTSTQKRWPDGQNPRTAGLGEAGRPHLAATQAPASRGS